MSMSLKALRSKLESRKQVRNSLIHNVDDQKEVVYCTPEVQEKSNSFYYQAFLLMLNKA